MTQRISQYNRPKTGEVKTFTQLVQFLKDNEKKMSRKPNDKKRNKPGRK